MSGLLQKKSFNDYCRMKQYFLQIIFSIYLGTLGFASAFAISQLITIPLICATVMFLLCVNFSINRRVFFDFTFILILFTFPQLIGALAGHRYFTETTLSHLVSYFAVPILFYLAPRIFIDKLQNASLLWKWLSCGWWFFLIFLLFEFAMINVFQVKLDDYLFRPLTDEYEPLVFGFIIRGRSFAEESAHAALFLGIVFFILRGLNLPGKYSLFFFMVGLTVMFGVSSWVAILAVLMSLILTHRINLKWKTVVTVTMTLTLILLVATYFEVSLWLELIGKFSSSSMDDRNDRFSASMNLIQNGSVFNSLFGLGPGYYKGANVQSVVGLPFLTFFQSGLIGLLSLVFMLTIYLIRAWKVNYWYACAIIYAAVCYGSISNYWLPWMWLIFAIVDSGKSKVRYMKVGAFH